MRKLPYRRPFVRDAFYLLAVLVEPGPRILKSYQVNLSRLADHAGMDRATARRLLEWLHNERWIRWIPNVRATGRWRHEVWILVDQEHGGLTVDQWIETFRHQWYRRHPYRYDRMM